MKPGRVQVAPPLGEVSAVQTWFAKGLDYLPLALFILVPILVFAGSVSLFLSGPNTKTPHEFEIGRFSGKADFYSRETRNWTGAKRGMPRLMTLYPGDKIRTAIDSDLDLKLKDTFDLRLKASSEIEIISNQRGANLKTFTFKLVQGSILGLPDKHFEDPSIQIETPAFTARIPHASFMAQVGENGRSSLSILDGQAEVHPHNSKEVIRLKPLEILNGVPGKENGSEPRRVGYQEWKALNEARDLAVVTAQETAEQLGLRSKAGSFFNDVSDEGAFYRPNWGYAERKFIQDEDDAVMLRLDYDVYPQDSFAGMYFKIKNLDLSKAKRLTLSVKGADEKPLADQFRIELKDRSSVIRGYAVKPIAKDWRFHSFDLNAQRPTPVTELVIVFENSRVGPLSTNSAVYIKDLSVE